MKEETRSRLDAMWMSAKHMVENDDEPILRISGNEFADLKQMQTDFKTQSHNIQVLNNDYTALLSSHQQLEAERDRLMEALIWIERECDGKNPHHLRIWNIAYNAIAGLTDKEAGRKEDWNPDWKGDPEDPQRWEGW